MTSKGCSFNGGICHEIVEECKGCKRSSEISTSWYCEAYPDPSKKWNHGKCNLATHVASDVAEKKAKINPLKASKRNSG
jgi:hypothetical protein